MKIDLKLELLSRGKSTDSSAKIVEQIANFCDSLGLDVIWREFSAEEEIQ